MPDIPGMDDFAGPSFHSARWDHTVDYRGKQFALIGAGASGFQIAPTIADDVEQLTVYQRTAQWVFPNPNYHRARARRRALGDPTPAVLRTLVPLPHLLSRAPASRWSATASIPTTTTAALAMSASNAATRELFAELMLAQLGDDEELAGESRCPTIPPTAKRMLQDNGSWLACLRKDNVELVRTGIERIVADGVITVDGTFRPADIICYATGFRHNDFLWPMHIVGRDGAVLRERWGIEPAAYLGITVKHFPNLFCLYGPGTNLAHGASLIYQSENQVDYVMHALHELLTSGHRALEPRPEVQDDYTDRYSERDLTDGVGARVGEALPLQEPEGQIFTISPWPIPTYWTWTKTFEPKDYVWA